MKALTFFFFTIVFFNFNKDYFIDSLKKHETETIIQDSLMFNRIPVHETQWEELRDSSSKFIERADSSVYWIFTSYVEQLVFSDRKGEKIVKGNRMDQTFFTINCGKSNQSYIRLVNKNCEKRPTLKICTPNKTKCTRTINLDYNEEISIDSCFIKYPETGPLDFDDFFGWIKLVFDELTEARVSCGPGAILKGDNSTFSEEVRLVFVQTDYSYYLDSIDFDLRFTTLLDNQIESIYIIEHDSDDDLVFCAGDVSDMADLYDLSDILVPSIDMVIEKLSSRDTLVEYRLIDSVLNTMLFKELKKGHWYELDVKLKNDPTYYAFNFQFLSDENLKYLKSFEK